MKRLALLSIILLAFISNKPVNPRVDLIKLNPKPIKLQKEVEIIKVKELDLNIPTMNEFLTALIEVESQGRDSIIGDKHLVGNEAVGALQIRPIMVREVNRILKKQKINKRYNLEDRFSRKKSIEMFMIWKNYHHSGDSFEKIARCWNGGPRGIKNKRTEHYWAKVQLELNKKDI